jgi:hypothetical protein
MGRCTGGFETRSYEAKSSHRARFLVPGARTTQQSCRPGPSNSHGNLYLRSIVSGEFDSHDRGGDFCLGASRGVPRAEVSSGDETYMARITANWAANNA